jgi:transposase
VVTERCPTAIRCSDPFHVVAWATEALDVERRRAWNDARALAREEPQWGRGRPAKDTPARPAREHARKLKGARYALWKNPEDLTERQSAKLAWIAKTDTRLYRAYLLKEGLRHVFSVKGDEGKQALDRWISWARRCRIPVFVELAGRIVRHRQTIDAALDHGLSQGPIDSTNTKIRPLTRIALGFRSPQALIALAVLALGCHRPALPGRKNHPRISQ